ncbi:monocarboxylate transporter 13-like [Glandiceps talaboti]
MERTNLIAVPVRRVFQTRSDVIVSWNFLSAEHFLLRIEYKDKVTYKVTNHDSEAVEIPEGPVTLTEEESGYQRHIPFEIPELHPQEEEEEEKTPRFQISKRWLVCIAGFLLDVPFFGMVMSFGELLLPLLDTFGGGTAAISWVGSLGFGIAYLGNPLSSRLVEIFGTRKVATFGVLLGGLALFLTSFVQSLSLMFLTYSFMFGLATNFTYNPPLILTGAWFSDKYHVFATCLQVAGIPFGSLVMNPLCQGLLQSMGLRDAYRTLAAIVVLAGLPCCFVLSPAPEDENTVKIEEDPIIEDDINENSQSNGSAWLDKMIKKIPIEAPRRRLCVSKCQNYFIKELWTDSIFILFLFGQLIKAIGYVFPFIHLISFMDSIGIPPTSGAFILTVKGGADMGGRLVAALIGGRLPFHLIHMFVISTAIMAVVTFILSFATNFGHVFFYAVFIGFWNGIYNALTFPLTTALFPKDMAGQAWAFCQAPPGLAITIGPAIAGAIYDSTSSYQIDFYVNAFFFALAMLIYTSIHVLRKMRLLYEARGFSIRKQKPTIIELTKLCLDEHKKQGEAKKPENTSYDTF